MKPEKNLHSDEIYDLLAQKDLGALQFQQEFRKSLIKWGIRAVIGLGVFGYLASKYSWGIWVLLAWGLMAMTSLAVLFWARQKINRRSTQIEEIAEQHRPSDSDP